MHLDKIDLIIFHLARGHRARGRAHAVSRVESLATILLPLLVQGRGGRATVLVLVLVLVLVPGPGPHGDPGLAGAGEVLVM